MSQIRKGKLIAVSLAFLAILGLNAYCFFWGVDGGVSVLRVAAFLLISGWGITSLYLFLPSKKESK